MWHLVKMRVVWYYQTSPIRRKHIFRSPWEASPLSVRWAALCIKGTLSCPRRKLALYWFIIITSEQICTCKEYMNNDFECWYKHTRPYLKVYNSTLLHSSLGCIQFYGQCRIKGDCFICTFSISFFIIWIIISNGYAFQMVLLVLVDPYISFSICYNKIKFSKSISNTKHLTRQTKLLKRAKRTTWKLSIMLIWSSEGSCIVKS